MVQNREAGKGTSPFTAWSFPCWQMGEGILEMSQKLLGWCFRAACANFQGWAERASLLPQRKQLEPKGLAGTWAPKGDRVWQFEGPKSKFLTEGASTLSLYSLLYQIFFCPFALCPCLHLTLKCYPMLKNAQDLDSSFHFISYPISLPWHFLRCLGLVCWGGGGGCLLLLFVFGFGFIFVLKERCEKRQETDPGSTLDPLNLVAALLLSQPLLWGQHPQNLLGMDGLALAGPGKGGQAQIAHNPTAGSWLLSFFLLLHQLPWWFQNMLSLFGKSQEGNVIRVKWVKSDRKWDQKVTEAKSCRV